MPITVDRPADLFIHYIRVHYTKPSQTILISNIKVPPVCQCKNTHHTIKPHSD